MNTHVPGLQSFSNLFPSFYIGLMDDYDIADHKVSKLGEVALRI